MDVVPYMLNFFKNYNLNYISGALLATALCSVGLYWLFYQIRFLKPGIVKKLFYIPAGKSQTDAVHLGGLPLGILLIAGASVFVYFAQKQYNFSTAYILLNSIVSFALLIAYGYCDDRFEIKPTAKLLGQFLIVSSFALLTSKTIYPQNSAISFVLMSGFGLAILNGTNLIDGLDTISLKFSFVTIGLFGALGFYYNYPELVLFSFFVMASLTGFGIYNKAPARVYLGEVGAAALGFTYLLFASLLYHHIREKIGSFSSMTVAFFPISIYAVELSVSFFRRLVNHRSPFRGDKLHIHHILSLYKGFSPSNTATLMSMGYLVFGLISFSLIQYPVLSFLSINILTIATYYAIGIKYWRTSETVDITWKNFAKMLMRKDVKVISSEVFNDFELIILKPKNQETSNVSTTEKEDELDKKKSA